MHPSTAWTTRMLLPGVLMMAACAPQTDRAAPADLILHQGRVYTLDWPEPSTDGRPASKAPFDSIKGWHHDATAVAIRAGRIVFVGPDSGALRFRGPNTRVMALNGEVVLPGMVDAHTHVAELGHCPLYTSPSPRD